MLIDVIATIPGTLEKQISLCMEVIDWCEKEQRTFLKQRIQTKLASLYVLSACVTPRLHGTLGSTHWLPLFDLLALTAPRL